MALVALWEPHRTLAAHCASIHTAKDFQERVRAEVPRCTLAFVPAGQTSYCQPLDVAYMQPLKSILKQHTAGECATRLVSMLLEETAAQPMEGVVLDRSLPFLRSRLCTYLAKAIAEFSGRESLRTRAWRHLLVEADARAESWAEAQRLYEAGSLVGPPAEAAAAAAARYVDAAPAPEPEAACSGSEASEEDETKEADEEDVGLGETEEVELPGPEELALIGDLFGLESVPAPAPRPEGAPAMSSKARSYARLAAAGLLREFPRHPLP